MAWHMGYPLSQTIFTSLYIDKLLESTPLSLDHTYFDRGEGSSDDESMPTRVLRAYCLGLIKTCWFVNSRVKAEHYYEVHHPKSTRTCRNSLCTSKFKLEIECLEF